MYVGESSVFGSDGNHNVVSYIKRVEQVEVVKIQLPCHFWFFCSGSLQGLDPELPLEWLTY